MSEKQSRFSLWLESFFVLAYVLASYQRALGWETAAAALSSTLNLNCGARRATPHHHVLPFLAMHDKPMACRLLNDTIASFRGRGIWEWVGPFFPATTTGAPGYTASAANTYFASEQLRCWE